MMIEGCFIPNEIYEQQRQYAIATGKTRSVGVICIRKPQPPAPSGASLVSLVLDPYSRFRAPEWLRYLIGPSADEMRQSGECSMILHISRWAEAAI